MNKLKQQFINIKNATPKRVQWLLLAAAFVVVLILLTLIIGRKHGNDISGLVDTVAPNISITPDAIDFTDTTVGQTRSESMNVTSDIPVRISVHTEPESTPGLTVRNTCENQNQIDNVAGCAVTVSYTPDMPANPHAVQLFVDWHLATNDEDATHEHKRVLITLGAQDAEPVVTPTRPVITEPQPEPEPEPDPIVDYEPEEYDYTPEPDYEPEPVHNEIRREIESIAPTTMIPEPVSIPDTPRKPLRAEQCSDFAIPGYDTYGIQIGWIKPSAGSYYFHPFSDRNCDNPTGIYNPDNGIITDIDNPGKKIGTDAEHIGYASNAAMQLPALSNPPAVRTVHAPTYSTAEADAPGHMIRGTDVMRAGAGTSRITLRPAKKDVNKFLPNVSPEEAIISSQPYDRRFVLRQFKPIPATIVSDIRADAKMLNAGTIPVRATVDRNVFADNGRTIIIPTGTLLLGYVAQQELPGPYKSVGRLDIKWYQFILPNGVEFNFQDQAGDPFSADAQGRVGVPGYGSTDYLEQFFMPMLTAIVPAAVNMIAPIADTFINQIDLDNNTVVQSGTVRSSELAKNELITAWNQVAQKLVVDMMSNTVPPFTIAAGTRINVYSPVDLIVSCGTADDEAGKSCMLTSAGERFPSPGPRRPGAHLGFAADGQSKYTYDTTDGSLIGQVRSFKWNEDYCECNNTTGECDIKADVAHKIAEDGLDYSTVLFYCKSLNYQAINNVRQDAIYQNQKDTGYTVKYNNGDTMYNGGLGLSGMNVSNKEYNQNVLGLTYNEDGTIENPFQAPATASVVDDGLTCDGGVAPDANGCCPGEEFTDMQEMGYNCCPLGGGDCFPPLL